jgi:hypothetical protein
MPLITAAQVISLSFSNLSTDPSLIKAQMIRATELQYIKPAVGEDLYDLLIAEHSSTYTGLNQTLVETYLQPALAYYVKLKMLPDLNMNTASQGIMVNTAEHANQATSSQRAELAESAKSSADALLKEAIRYIEDNESSFPLYTNSSDKTTGVLIGGFSVGKKNVTNPYPWRK